MTAAPKGVAGGSDASRAAFERWYSDDGASPKAVARSGDGYVLMGAHQAWEAWQACVAWLFAGMGAATELDAESLAALDEQIVATGIPDAIETYVELRVLLLAKVVEASQIIAELRRRAALTGVTA